MNARRDDIPVPGVLSEADATRVEAAFGVGREQVESGSERVDVAVLQA